MMGAVNEVITHEGVQYRKVEREAQVGDKVVALRDAGFGVYTGDVRNIVDLETGYPRFKDKAGHYFFRNEYATLEPLPATMPKLTDAKPGDRVRIVAADDCNRDGYVNGDEFIVKETWDNRGGVDVVDERREGDFELYAEEFEVVRELRDHNNDYVAHVRASDDQIALSLRQDIAGQSREVVRTPGGEVGFRTELSTPPDNVEKPAHYNAGNVEVIEIIEQLTAGYDGYTAYCLGNVLKYIARAPYKHDEPTEDLRKADRYLSYALASIDKPES